VKYEYADSDGGGRRIDYFKAVNLYTLPATVDVVLACAGEISPLLSFESVEW
jgi:hypothetical protein